MHACDSRAVCVQHAVGCYAVKHIHTATHASRSDEVQQYLEVGLVRKCGRVRQRFVKARQAILDDPDRFLLRYPACSGCRSTHRSPGGRERHHATRAGWLRVLAPHWATCLQHNTTRQGVQPDKHSVGPAFLDERAKRCQLTCCTQCFVDVRGQLLAHLSQTAAAATVTAMAPWAPQYLH
jgi:hypothetical protein